MTNQWHSGYDDRREKYQGQSERTAGRYKCGDQDHNRKDEGPAIKKNNNNKNKTKTKNKKQNKKKERKKKPSGQITADPALVVISYYDLAIFYGDVQ
jgi:hypothetical protein